MTELLRETRKYAKAFKFLPQYDLDSRLLVRHIYALEKDINYIIQTIEREKSLAKKG